MFSRYLKNTSFSSTKPTPKCPVACTTFSMTMANTCHLAAMNLLDPLRHSRAHHGESGRTTHQCHDQRRREEPAKLPFVGWLALFDHLCQIEPMSQTPQQQKMFFFTLPPTIMVRWKTRGVSPIWWNSFPLDLFSTEPWLWEKG